MEKGKHNKHRLMKGAFAAVLDGDESVAKSHLYCLSDEGRQEVLDICQRLIEQVRKIS